MWANALYYLIFGYLLSVLLETPVLLVGLSRPHSWKVRLFAGIWLSGCTYPVVIFVIPVLCRWLGLVGYDLLIAETLAPLAECLLFWAITKHVPMTTGQRTQDCITIVVANLVSFLVGLSL